MAETRGGSAAQAERSGKRGTTYDELLALAHDYGVENNALFVAASKQYQLQQEVLEMIHATLQEDCEAVTTKEYVKGRQNLVANPAITEYNKTATAANGTVTTLIKIVESSSKGGEAKVSKLEQLLNEIDD